MYPYVKEYKFRIEVYDDPEPKKDPKLGDRVFFEIIEINRNGWVKVMLKGPVADIKLIRMLTNETVNFFVSPYDRSEYRNSPR